MRPFIFKINGAKLNSKYKQFSLTFDRWQGVEKNTFF